MKQLLILLLSSLVLLSCFHSKPDALEVKKTPIAKHSIEVPLKSTINTADAIFATPQVPILCYHRIRNILPTDGANMKTNPENHSVMCALMPPCIASNYSIITNTAAKGTLKHNTYTSHLFLCYYF